MLRESGMASPFKRNPKRDRQGGVTEAERAFARRPKGDPAPGATVPIVLTREQRLQHSLGGKGAPKYATPDPRLERTPKREAGPSGWVCE
jgi:hypothetical protein